MLDNQTVVRFLNEEDVADRVKVEDLLTVWTEVRSAAHLIVPAELPGGISLGQAIDEAFSRAYMGRPPVDLPYPSRLIWQLQAFITRALRQPVAYRSFLVRDAFVRVVHRSDPYRALSRWSGRLGLKMLQAQLRPTIDEIYIYRRAGTEGLLQEIQALRARLRREFLVQFHHEGGPFRVFPEESQPEFGLKVGKLLGYPECCTQRYVEARSQGENLEEIASREASGEGVEDLAYFARDYIPCGPDCTASVEKGQEILDRLEELDPRLAQLQTRAYRDNRERVRRFPEIIKERQDQIQKRWGDMWLRGPES